MKPIRKTNNELRRKFIDAAESQVGYQANPSENSIYAPPGTKWSGAFIDFVASQTGVRLPSHRQTSAALSFYVRSLRIHRSPRPGDIVFFNFPQDNDYGMPHVGIVTDVQHFARHGMFQCIEGQTATGTPKGGRVNNGVYRRTRYASDVLAFARPDFKRSFVESSEGPQGVKNLPKVKASIIKRGLKHPTIPVLQIALSKVVPLRGAEHGTWDHKTAAAFGNFQRRIGYAESEVTGLPDPISLSHLAQETNLFICEE